MLGNLPVINIASITRKQRANASFLQTSSHGMVPLTFRVGLPMLVNLIKKILYENPQRLISSAVLDPVKSAVLAIMLLSKMSGPAMFHGSKATQRSKA